MVMDLAIGGDYTGDPTVAQVNANAVFPAEVLVDYVRVYNINNSTGFIAPSSSSAKLTNQVPPTSWSPAPAPICKPSIHPPTTASMPGRLDRPALLQQPRPPQPQQRLRLLPPKIAIAHRHFSL